MIESFKSILPHIIGAFFIIIACIASAHVILNKRDTRAAVGWVGLIWLVPALGSLLYILLGINRIRRRAKGLRSSTVTPSFSRFLEKPEAVDIPAEFRGFAHLVQTVTQRPLLKGNMIHPLVNGDEAYPAMIDAINRAEHSINMMTYIFDNDSAGKRFVEALVRASQRGVEVRSGL